MKRFSYIIAILLLIIALIFALQNTSEITVNFFAWSWTLSAALLMILIFLIGLIAGWLFELTVVWKKNQEIKALKRKTLLPGSNQNL